MELKRKGWPAHGGHLSGAVLQVGSPEWLDQQDKLDKINLQAHQSAQSHSDEYVVEAMVSSANVSLLLHQLLVIEVSLSSQAGDAHT